MQDNGSGISPENYENVGKLFSSFFFLFYFILVGEVSNSAVY